MGWVVSAGDPPQWMRMGWGVASTGDVDGSNVRMELRGRGTVDPIPNHPLRRRGSQEHVDTGQYTIVIRCWCDSPGCCVGGISPTKMGGASRTSMVFPPHGLGAEYTCWAGTCAFARIGERNGHFHLPHVQESSSEAQGTNFVEG